MILSLIKWGIDSDGKGKERKINGGGQSCSVKFEMVYYYYYYVDEMKTNPTEL